MNHPSDTGFTNPGEIWNKRFDRAEYIFGKAPNEYLASKAGLLSSGQRALLVADGEGRNSVWCAQQGLTVDAFDLSPIAVDKAKALARECGVEVNFSVASIEDWGWTPETYDVVVVIFIQFAKPSLREKIFANCIRTLKPGGLLILPGFLGDTIGLLLLIPPVRRLITDAIARRVQVTERFGVRQGPDVVIDGEFIELDPNDGSESPRGNDSRPSGWTRH